MASSNSTSKQPQDSDAIKSVKNLGIKPSRDIEKAAEFLTPPATFSLFRPFTASLERQKLMEVRKDFLKAVLNYDIERTKEENRREEVKFALEIAREKERKCKGFTCKMEGCGAAFDDDEQLMGHFQRFHTGIKCKYGYCGAAFDDEQKLTEHFQQCHSGKIMPCPDKTCQTFFVDIHAVFKHVAQVHKGEIKLE